MVITLSGITGVGKSYFKKQIQDILGIDMQTIVTTRNKRDGEKSGIDKKFVTDKEFEEMKKNKDIIVTFELLGYKYGYQRLQMKSEKTSVVELHYSIIYQLKKEIKDVFSIYIIPKNIEIAKQKLKERNLPEKIEKERLKEIEEHMENFNSDKDLRQQFDYILYNDYTDKATNELIETVKKLEKREVKI